MNRFKVGDEVRLAVEARIIANNLGDGNIYVVEDIKSSGIKFKGLFPYYHSSLFELVKERNMKKFKVGDKVVRVSETYGKAIKGEVYEVSEVSDNGHFGSCGINLKGHGGVSGMFNYEASCFELYDDNILSPLEAAEAMLNGEDLLYLNYLNNWAEAGKSLDYSLKFLSKEKFKRKPKTVTINGVEVVAPVELPRYAEGYVPSICYREVQTASAGKGRIMWAKEEDAQKALDAMLIPFKQ